MNLVKIQIHCNKVNYKVTLKHNVLSKRIYMCVYCSYTDIFTYISKPMYLFLFLFLLIGLELQ